ncbi:MAG TPA: hypothetical protein VEK57_21960 [Thermoanaerobaculia bacterium]|nr:hypothetical protein [Thermoanaerobaculia bacterium]
MRVTKNVVAVALGALMITLSVGAQTTVVNPVLRQQMTVPNQNLIHYFSDEANVTKGRLLFAGANNAGARYFGFNNDTGDYLGFFTATYMIFRAPASTEQLRISSTGVTIGTNAAETNVKLTVNGAIDVKGNIAAKYQDVAEWVPAFGAPKPGTVVILSEDANNHVIASSTSYDTRVAGVVSAQPGLILGEAAPNKVQVATTGRVKVMVDASAAPIKIGDLLVTSDKSGVAMKSMPVEVAGIKMHRPGTVVGKALEPLAGGTGEILVLLSMQ